MEETYRENIFQGILKRLGSWVNWRRKGSIFKGISLTVYSTTVSKLLGNFGPFVRDFGLLVAGYQMCFDLRVAWSRPKWRLTLAMDHTNFSKKRN